LTLESLTGTTSNHPHSETEDRKTIFWEKRVARVLPLPQIVKVFALAEVDENEKALDERLRHDRNFSRGEKI
jgi:hypothetical protein